MSKPITDYDSDFAPAFVVYNSASLVDSTNKQHAAHSLSFVLFHLKQLLVANEPARAIELLEDGLSELFPHTDVYHLCRARWFEYLEGNLKPEQEPLYLLTRREKANE